MMNNYNSPSYYRSNPYAQLGYMPPRAQVNRKRPQYEVQIPQGSQFFQPTTKKHYGQSYKSQIEADHVMASPQKRSPLQKQALQRSYFRSLNSKDIQGATTNTLISKAVRNKLKAQHALQQKRQLERLQRQQQLQRAKQPKLYDLYHKKNTQQPINHPENFHTIQKKRQEELERNYSRHHENANKQDSREYNYEQKQAEMMRKARQKLGYSQYQQNNNKKADYTQNNNSSYQNKYEPKHYQYMNQRKSQQNQNYHQRRSHQYPQPSSQRFQPQNNQHTYQPYQQPSSQRFQPQRNQTRQINYNVNNHNNYSSIPHLDNKNYHQNYQYEKQRNAPYTRQANQYQNPRKSLPSYQQKSNTHYIGNSPNYQPQVNYPYRKQAYSGKSGFKNNQQMRRFNPTYLSYASPSFSLAGRHVIGNH